MVSARQMHPPRQISTRCIGLSSEAVNGAFDGQKKVIFLSATGLRAPLVDTMKRARGRARGPLRTPVSLFVNLDFWGASKKRKGGEKPDWPLREIEGNSRRCFPLFLSSHLSTRARFLCLFLRPHKNQKKQTTREPSRSSSSSSSAPPLPPPPPPEGRTLSTSPTSVTPSPSARRSRAARLTRPAGCRTRPRRRRRRRTRRCTAAAGRCSWG